MPDSKHKNADAQYRRVILTDQIFFFAFKLTRIIHKMIRVFSFVLITDWPDYTDFTDFKINHYQLFVFKIRVIM